MKSEKQIKEKSFWGYGFLLFVTVMLTYDLLTQLYYLPQIYFRK